MSAKQFYHALNMTCIEGLDCDIPLDIGFGIQHFINEYQGRWGKGRRRWGFANNGHLRMAGQPRLCDLPDTKNNHPESKMPLFKKSSAGAGHW